MRRFYQVYVDAESWSELFDIGMLDEKFNVEHIHATILKELSIYGLKTFREDGKQFIVKLDVEDTEVKFTKDIRWINKVWIQISSTDKDVPETILEKLMEAVKLRYEKAHSE